MNNNYVIDAKKDFSRKCDIYTYIMFLIFPLVIIDYRNITVTKYMSFLIISFLLFGAILFSFFGMLLDGLRIKIKIKKVLFFKIDFFLILYIVSGIISFIFSPYKLQLNFQGKSIFLHGSGRYDGFFVLLLYISIFFLLSNFGDFKINHIVVISITTIIMCVISIIQLCGINFLDFYPEFAGKITDFISTVGNVDIFSSMFCIFVPITVISYIVLNNTKIVDFILLIAQFISIFIMMKINVSSGKLALIFTLLFILPFLFNNIEKILKIMNFFAVLSAVVALNEIIIFKYLKELHKTNVLLNFNYKAFVLMTFAVLFFLLQIVLKEIKKKRDISLRFVRIIAVVLIIVFLCYLCIYGFGINIYKTNVKVENNLSSVQNKVPNKDSLGKEVSDFIKGDITESSGSYRVGIWKNAFKMGIKRPLFGTGIGTFLESFEAYIAETKLSKKLDLVDNAHNEYLHIFCTLGIFGLFSYCGFLLLLAIKTIKYISKNPYIVILGSAVLCYCVQAFFCFSIVIVTPLFWICAGLLYKKIKEEESGL